MPGNLLDDAIAADVTRGLLLYSQANYFGAKACLQLASEFTSLSLDSLSRGFKSHAKNDEVPDQGQIHKYLCAAVKPLKKIPDKAGSVVIGPHRDSVISNIPKYVDLIEQAKPLRDAICHGVLTKDEDSQLVLHPTRGGGPSVLWEEVPKFLVQSQNAYAAASDVHVNLRLLALYVQ